MPGGEWFPEGGAGGLSIGEDESFDFAAAKEAVIPAEVVVEEEFEAFGLTGGESPEGAALDFGFEAATAEGAGDAAIGMEEGFGTGFFGGGAFGAGDDAEGDGFGLASGGSEVLEDGVIHP